LLEISGSQ